MTVFGKPRIRMPDGKWYDWEVLESGGSAPCPVCGGRLSNQEPDGYSGYLQSVKLTYGGVKIPYTISLSPKWKKLPQGQVICLQCHTVFKLTEIEKPVMVARKQEAENAPSN